MASVETKIQTLGQLEAKACVLSTERIILPLRVHYCNIWFTRIFLFLVLAAISL